MKTGVLFFIAILFSEILVAQKSYDPLKDSLLKKPGNTIDFDLEMSKKINAIRGESEFNSAINEQYKTDFFQSSNQLYIKY